MAVCLAIDIPQYAQSMFEAGSDLSSRSTQEIFYQDYKTFSASDVSFGVGQVTSVSAAGLRQLIPSLQKLMDETYAQNPSTMLFFLLTNIIEENSIVLCSGHKAQELLKQSNHIEQIPEEGFAAAGNGFPQKAVCPLHHRNLAAVSSLSAATPSRPSSKKEGRDFLFSILTTFLVNAILRSRKLTSIFVNLK